MATQTTPPGFEDNRHFVCVCWDNSESSRGVNASFSFRFRIRTRRGHVSSVRVSFNVLQPRPDHHPRHSLSTTATKGKSQCRRGISCSTRRHCIPSNEPSSSSSANDTTSKRLARTQSSSNDSSNMRPLFPRTQGSQTPGSANSHPTSTNPWTKTGVRTSLLVRRARVRCGRSSWTTFQRRTTAARSRGR